MTKGSVQQTVLPPIDDKALDLYLRQIADLQEEISRANERARREIAGIMADTIDLVSPMQAEATQYLAAIYAYTDLHWKRLSGGKRRIQRRGGVIWRRRRSEVVTIADPAAVLQQLKIMGLTDCIVTTERIDRHALRRLSPDALAVLKGVTLRPGDETFAIKTGRHEQKTTVAALLRLRRRRRT